MSRDPDLDMHPIFEDVPNEEIGWIEVLRWQGGRFVTAPRRWDPSELDGLEVLARAYGGGDYELKAKTPGGQVLRKAKASLDGPPRSLDPETAEAAAGAAVSPVRVAPAAAGDPTGGLLGIMFQAMMQQSAQAAQMQAAQMQQTTQILLAVLSKGDEQARAHVESMQALHDRFAQSQAQQQAQTLQLLGTLHQGGSGNPLDTFMKGIEFARSQEPEEVEEIVEGEEGGGLVETITEMASAAAPFLEAKHRARQQAQQQAQQQAAQVGASQPRPEEIEP